MLICRTPLRISFFGGGTDFPMWYKNNEGLVISTSINKYCFLTIRKLAPIFDYNYRLRYFTNEQVNKINEIKHNSIREALKKFHNSKVGLEMIYNADLPAKTGLGSSSAFSVSLIHTLQCLNNIMVSKRKIAMDAIELEQKILKENVGSQDQFTCTFGGLNTIKFNHNSIEVSPIIINRKRIDYLFDHCLLFYTKNKRFADKVEKDKFKNFSKIKSHLNEIYNLAIEAKKLIYCDKNFIKDFGNLMHQNWILKKQLSNLVSNKKLDEIYQFALSKGALGGKLLGAGGGGFFLFIVPNKKVKHNLKESLTKKGLPNINFNIDFTGTQIIYHKESDDF